MALNRFLNLFAFLVILTQLFVSCQDDEINDLVQNGPTLQEQLDMALGEKKLLTLKNILLDASLSDNLITEVKEVNETASGGNIVQFRIDFENQSFIAVEFGLIDSLKRNYSLWTTLFHFSDGTDQKFYSIGDLEIEETSALLNPSGVAPLTGLVNFITPIPGRVKIVVKGKNGVSSNIVKHFESIDTKHEIAVLGLYASFNNEVEIIFTKADGTERANKVFYMQTEPITIALPLSINVDVYNNEQMEEGLTLISYLGNSNPNTPIMIDEYGEIRWFLDFASEIELKTLAYNNGIERLQNGNLYFGDTANDRIYEIDMLGRKVNQWLLTGYEFHHNVQEKPNGNFIVSVNKLGSTHLNGKPTIEDYIIEIDRKTGGVVKEWDLKESLDEYRITQSDQLGSSTVDWIHVNAVIYDETDNTIIVSGRHQGLIKLDYNNDVKWIMNPHKGWGMNRNGQDLNQFLLTPLNQNGNAITDQAILDGDLNHADFEWNWYQHAPMLKPNGNIMMFDNGDNRNYTGLEKYSRAVEYEINKQDMTVKQIWSYGKGRGLETFSRIVSDVDFLPNSNNILFSPGFQATNPDGMGGKVVEINYLTGEVISEIRITTTGITLHRAERLTVYP